MEAMHLLRKTRCPRLLVLDDVLRGCDLKGRYREGTYAVAVERIVGTFDRCCDFDGLFQPFTRGFARWGASCPERLQGR
jgi:hypothetical protein